MIELAAWQFWSQIVGMAVAAGILISQIRHNQRNFEAFREEMKKALESMAAESRKDHDTLVEVKGRVSQMSQSLSRENATEQLVSAMRILAKELKPES